MLRPMAKLNQIQKLLRAFFNLLARPLPQMQRQRDILEAIKRREQVEKLKDEADLVAANTSEIVVREFAKILAFDSNLAGCGPVEAADQVQERRLSRTGRPDNAETLLL